MIDSRFTKMFTDYGIPLYFTHSSITYFGNRTLSSHPGLLYRREQRFSQPLSGFRVSFLEIWGQLKERWSFICA